MLVNAEEGIAQSLSSTAASVQPDGSVFWSRPGLLKVLCKLSGLRSFPLDTLNCTLEFSAWTLGGWAQDLKPREKGSVVLHEGHTGGSTFQEYEVLDATSELVVKYYASSGSQPFPAVLFHVSFKRATTTYFMKFVWPQLLLIVISWITYFMHPSVGERLGFGVTLLLAVIASDLATSEYMPICREILLTQVLSWMALFFACVALVESGVVLFFFHLAELRGKHLLPRFLRSITDRVMDMLEHQLFTGRAGRLLSVVRSSKAGQSGAGTKGTLPDRAVMKGPKGPSAIWEDVCASSSEGPDPSSDLFHGSLASAAVKFRGRGTKVAPKTGDDERSSSLCTAGSISGQGSSSPGVGGLADASDMKAFIRQQLYAQAFYVLDDNFSGSLDKKEVKRFARFAVGPEFAKTYLNEFMDALDLDQNGLLSFQEFALFCDNHLMRDYDHESLTELVQGFIAVNERRYQAAEQHWRRVALKVDLTFQRLVPAVSLLAMVVLFIMDF